MNIKIFFLALFAIVAASSAHSAILTQWTFEGDVSTSSTGSGTASLLGTTATFAAGNGGGRGWNTTNYQNQSTGSGTEGVQFMVPTTGKTDITISYDHRGSGTSSRWSQFEYTTDGGSNWTSHSNNSGGLSPHDTFYTFTIDLSAIEAVENNTGFGFRIVSIFSPIAFDQSNSLSEFAANSAYMRANSGAVYSPSTSSATGDYGGTGTWRFDNVTVNAIPEPTAAILGTIGMLGLLRRRRF